MSRVWVVFAWFVALVGCGATSPGTPASVRESAPATRGAWLVVAPHPDDEALMATGVIRRALDAGLRVHVVVVTNGDYTCERDGWLRQEETVRAMALLGLHEENVTFLGYPDGHLAHLGATPLAPVERRTREGACEPGNTTYGARGAGGADFHTARHGRAATYDAESLAADLAEVLEAVQPSDVVVPHPMDDHPDHAATYAYFRRALERASLTVLPDAHRAVVHEGPCWPNGDARLGPCPAIDGAQGGRMPSLPAPYGAYAPRRIVPVDAELKARVIDTYRSQLGAEPARDWLVTFARSEEPFWDEAYVADPLDRAQLVRAEGRPTPDASTFATREEAGTLVLTRADTVVARWTLPLDEHGGPIALRVDRRGDEPVTEVTIRWRGQVLGVAILPET